MPQLMFSALSLWRLCLLQLPEWLALPEPSFRDKCHLITGIDVATGWPFLSSQPENLIYLAETLWQQQPMLRWSQETIDAFLLHTESNAARHESVSVQCMSPR